MIKKLTYVLFLMTISSFAQQEVASAEKLIQQGEISKAKNLLEKIITEDPQDYEAISYLGDIASFEKNWDVALSYYKQLLNSDLLNADYNFRYGGALGLKAINVSRIKAVVYISDIKKYLEKAAALDSKHIKSRRALVELYMQLPGLLGGSESKAKRYAGELEKIAPLEGALSRTFILKETGKETEARILLQTTLNQVKKPYTTSNLNYLNYEFGKLTAEYNIHLPKGLKLLDTYISQYNYKDIHSLEWAYLRKAQIFAALKNKSEAISSINKALALNHNFEEAKIEKQRILKL